MSLNGDQIRKVLLEIVADLSRDEHAIPQATSVIQRAEQVLPIRGKQLMEQALLTQFHDLFRTGYLAWGGNLANPGPPFFHVTQHGRRALAQFSRDPANPDGYLHYLSSKGILDPIADSYVREALRTYNADCPKATAVLVGAAAECMALRLKDIVSGRLNTLGEKLPRDLDHWIIKRVLDSLEGWFNRKKGQMPASLSEAFDSYWPAFTHQIRTIRNEAGHPKTVEPVTHDAVHASLLILPELVALIQALSRWVSESYGTTIP